MTACKSHDVNFPWLTFFHFTTNQLQEHLLSHTRKITEHCDIMSNSNNNNNNNATTSTSDITDEILLSLLACFPSSFSTANHSSQEKGRSKSASHIRHDSIDGVIFFQDAGTNKRRKFDLSHKQDSPSFIVDLNDTSEPTPQDMVRRNNFVEKRRNRAERHILAHAEHLLSQAMQIEAEQEAPQDHQDEFVAAINERSRRFPSARISERLILQ